MLVVGCSCAPLAPTDAGADALAPDRQWVELDAQDDAACARRSDGVSVCWGNGWAGSTVLPAGLSSIASVGSLLGCGLDPGGSIVCVHGGGWEPMIEWAPPSGSFRALDVSIGGPSACAIDAAGGVTCWYNGGPATFAAPSSEPVRQIATTGITCAVGRSGHAFCWNPFAGGAVVQPPDIALSSVASRDSSACGVTTTSALVCWGDPMDPVVALAPTTGAFTDVALGAPSCALSTTGEAVCWGEGWTTLTGGPAVNATQPTGERYRRIAVGTGFVCGILLTGALSCWGTATNGVLTPPNPP